MIYKVLVHLGIVIIAWMLFSMIRRNASSRAEGAYGKYLIAHVGVWLLFFLLELRWMYTAPNQVDLLRGLSILDAALFLPGILFYMYLSRRIESIPDHFRTYHWVPVVAHVIAALCLLIIGQDYYLFLFEYKDLKLYYGLVEFGVILFNGYFLFKSYLLLGKVRQFSDLATYTTVSFRRYLWTLMLTFFIGGVALAVRIFSSLGFSWVYEVSRSVLLFGMVYLAYHMVFQRSRFEVNLAEADSSYRRLDEASIETLKQKVTALVEEQQIFLKDQLTLSEFSQYVDASPNDLSWLLNNSYGKSFYEFLNQYRVHYFIEKVHENAHRDRTILSLAMESGFRSNATFYKAFKAEKGQTPNQYIKSISKTVPVED